MKHKMEQKIWKNISIRPLIMIFSKKLNICNNLLHSKHYKLSIYTSNLLFLLLFILSIYLILFNYICLFILIFFNFFIFLLKGTKTSPLA